MHADALRVSFRSPWLTTREAAEYLRVSDRTLKTLLAERRIPARRPAGTRGWRFRRDELDAWLDGADVKVVSDGGPRGVVVRAIVKPQIRATLETGRRAYP